MLRVFIDVYPYWSQVFLTLALAIERFILICHGEKAEQWLSKARRKMLYFVAMALSFVFPTAILADFVSDSSTHVRKYYYVSYFNFQILL